MYLLCYNVQIYETTAAVGAIGILWKLRLVFGWGRYAIGAWLIRVLPPVNWGQRAARLKC